jgi:cyclophilin family peptidyl-prolyl cis-trans isomerase
MLALSVLVSSAGCGPKDAPKVNLDDQTWMTGRPGYPAVCLSKIPIAGRLGPDQAAYSNGLSALQEGDVVGARAAIESATGGHPAILGLQGVLALVEGKPLDARPIYRDLAADFPEDGCVQHTAGVVYLSAGLGRLARGFVRSAIQLQPDELETRYLNGLVERSAGDEESAARAFRDVVQRSPGHPGASLALASYHLARGDGLLAVPMLRAARDGGLEVGDTLARALYRAGDKGPYIQEASRLGWPLGDGGALAKADAPLDAYRQLLGVGEDGELSAFITTSAGPLECELFWEAAPVTVGNFVGLAKGTQPWRDPRTMEAGEGALYPGTVFHRIIPEFMIQGGDARGDGTGDPGYRFADEIDPSLRFDKPGRLAMANSGPDTNGSQFFVTDVPTPHLNAKHTIFGQCTDASLDTVRRMARVPRDARDKPSVPIVLESIEFR